MTKTLAIFLLFAGAGLMGFVGHSVGWFAAGACVMLACVIGVDR